MKKIAIAFIVALGSLFLPGCKKFLDEKPDARLTVPSSLADLQALLDNFTVMNSNDPSAGEVSADNYYLNTTDWNGLSQENYRRMYIWEKDYVFAPISNDWYDCYRTIYTANTVLETVRSLSGEIDLVEKNNIEGQALVFRAKTFLSIALIWALAYEESTSSNDLGIPLRLNTDFHEVSKRASVRETYNQIITDLKQAIPLLPINPKHVLRPSKPAAYAFLSRTYLAMRNYEKAGIYADSCLMLKKVLMDFNGGQGINPSSSAFAFQQFNPEVIMSSVFSSPHLSQSRAKIDSTLYSSYHNNDLRKILFFRSNGNGTFAFRGSYDGGSAQFGGISTNEVYLTRAECYARQGNISLAMNDLNTLLAKRWKSGTFVQITASSADEALVKILTERRKELIMRGIRWMDIKRLNTEGHNIVLKRFINGSTYILQPSDPKYALAIPEDIIDLTGMPQNPR